MNTISEICFSILITSFTTLVVIATLAILYVIYKIINED